MRVVEIFLCVFVGRFVSGLSVIDEQDVTLPHTFPGFFQDFGPFPSDRSIDFTPYDTIFSSWLTPAPDFHMLAEFPPIMNVPRIRVFCDETHLSVQVDKRINGAMLTAQEVQLGSGCHSNGEQPNEFVFTYSVDECGTTRKVQNGLVVFVNSVHLNVREPRAAWRQTPSTIHVSCVPKRSFFTAMSSENGKTFNIKAMDSSWTSAAESNVYKRGQVINLQVSANTGPGEQLFIQSCFVSPSPDPRSKPRHAVIMNKGCTGALGSPHPVVQFVASNRGGVVNFVLNTTYLMAQIYVHCTALVSDQGVTTGSKSCNYNLMKSRWEELSGDVKVCKCCSSKCKSSPGRHHEGFRATVSTGPFVTVDTVMRSTPDVSEQQQPTPDPVADSMQSDAAAMDPIVSSPTQKVVVASQDPVSKLILWLPGQVEHREYSSEMSNDLPEPLPTPRLNPPTDGIDSPNKLKGDISVLDLNFLMMVDGWPIPPQRDAEADSTRQKWFGRSGVLDIDMPQVDILLPAEVEDEPTLQVEAAEKSQERPTDVEPIIRSKIQFSKSADGTQTLSYEEEVVKKPEAKPATMGQGMDLREEKCETKRKGLQSTFLDFLRKMDKAE